MRSQVMPQPVLQTIPNPSCCEDTWVLQTYVFLQSKEASLHLAASKFVFYESWVMTHPTFPEPRSLILLRSRRVPKIFFPLGAGVSCSGARKSSPVCWGEGQMFSRAADGRVVTSKWMSHPKLGTELGTLPVGGGLKNRNVVGGRGGGGGKKHFFVWGALCGVPFLD